MTPHLLLRAHPQDKGVCALVTPHGEMHPRYSIPVSYEIEFRVNSSAAGFPVLFSYSGTMKEADLQSLVFELTSRMKEAA